MAETVPLNKRNPISVVGGEPDQEPTESDIALFRRITTTELSPEQRERMLLPAHL